MLETRKYVILGLVLLNVQLSWQLSDKRLCADPKCQKIISTGTGRISYIAGDDGMVSFKINSIIRVMSKSAGSDPSLWGIEVNGRKGYAPKNYILEKTILVRQEDLIEVPIEAAAPKENAAETVILKPSESVDVNAAATEVTTTTPLSVVADVVNQTVALNQEVNGSATQEIQGATVKPQQVGGEIVDGTALPHFDDIHGTGPTLFEDDEDDDFDDDEDDDDDEDGDDDEFDIDRGDVNEKPNIFAKPNAEPISKSKEVKLVKKVKKPKITQPQEETRTKPAQDNNNEVKTANEISSELKTETPNTATNENAKVEPEFAKETNVSVNASSIANETVANENVENVVADSENNDDLSLPTGSMKIDDDDDSVDNNEKESKQTITKTTTTPRVSETNSEPKSNDAKESANAFNKTTNGIPNQRSNEQELEPEILELYAPTGGMKIDEESERKNEIQAEPIIDENVVNASIVTEEPLPVQSTALPADITVNVDASTAQSIGTNEANEKANIEVQQTDQVDSNITKTADPEESQATTTNDELPQLIVTTELPAAAEIANEAKIVEEIHSAQIQNDAATTTTTTASEVPATETTQPDVVAEETTTTPQTPREPVINQQPTENQYQNVEAHWHQAPDMPLPQLPLFNQPTTYQPENAYDSKAENRTQENANVNNETENTQNVEEATTTTQQVPIMMNPYGNANMENPVEQEAQNSLPNIMQYPPLPNMELPHEPPAEYFAPSPTESVPETVDDPVVTETPYVPNSNEEQYQYVGEQYTETTTSLPTQQQTPQEPVVLPSKTPETVGNDIVPEQGLFSKIYETVQGFMSNGKKEDQKLSAFDKDYANEGNDRFLLSRNERHADYGDCHCDTPRVTLDNFADVFLTKVFEMSQLLVCLGITAASTLLFLFGYYCFCNSSREGSLLSRLNLLERSLLASSKENTILKHDLTATRNKLFSIEDNSFGSNDMVMSLKRELEDEIMEKEKLREQVYSLEKELENAAEAGLELNKIVSELLSNQAGDETIISSVEELQRQLNEQQNTIVDINANLAEKSRENSELQLMIAEQNARLTCEIASLQRENDDLETEKGIMQSRLDETKAGFDEDLSNALEGKNMEIKRLQSEIIDYQRRIDYEHSKCQTGAAKIEALEDCMKSLKKNPNINVNELADVVNMKAELLDAQKKRATLKEELESEQDARKSIESTYQNVMHEFEVLKKDFMNSEKDKLEAVTRLEVLSSYFKDKEMQLQKELSLKEAMWFKQQGEAISTVDRLTTMQEEIQSLKSQNDSLRAEIEAQLAAHKAHTGTLENRAHETWLEARQHKRKYEEARAEATVLRRQLTAMADTNILEPNRSVNAAGVGNGDFNSAPSPIHMDGSSPLLGRMPLPPFMPPPFMGPPPPFMAVPPPFAASGEMRPPPLGRIMSPPPPPQSSRQPRSGQYTPEEECDDYEDYDDDDHYIRDDDDDDDDEDDDGDVRYQRRGDAGDASWRERERERERDRHRNRDRDRDRDRDSYYISSYSPTDNRYNYVERDRIATYETETDFSPPPSPRGRRVRGGSHGHPDSYKSYSPPPTASSPINDDRTKSAKTSDSDKSYNSLRRGRKGGKSMV